MRCNRIQLRRDSIQCQVAGGRVWSVSFDAGLSNIQSLASRSSCILSGLRMLLWQSGRCPKDIWIRAPTSKFSDQEFCKERALLRGIDCWFDGTWISNEFDCIVVEAGVITAGGFHRGVVTYQRNIQCWVCGVWRMDTRNPPSDKIAWRHSHTGEVSWWSKTVRSGSRGEVHIDNIQLPSGLRWNIGALQGRWSSTCSNDIHVCAKSVCIGNTLLSGFALSLDRYDGCWRFENRVAMADVGNDSLVWVPSCSSVKVVGNNMAQTICWARVSSVWSASVSACQVFDANCAISHTNSARILSPARDDISVGSLERSRWQTKELFTSSSMVIHSTVSNVADTASKHLAGNPSVLHFGILFCRSLEDAIQGLWVSSNGVPINVRGSVVSMNESKEEKSYEMCFDPEEKRWKIEHYRLEGQENGMLTLVWKWDSFTIKWHRVQRSRAGMKNIHDGACSSAVLHAPASESDVSRISNSAMSTAGIHDQSTGHVGLGNSHYSSKSPAGFSSVVSSKTFGQFLQGVWYYEKKFERYEVAVSGMRVTITACSGTGTYAVRFDSSEHLWMLGQYQLRDCSADFATLKWINPFDKTDQNHIVHWRRPRGRSRRDTPASTGGGQPRACSISAPVVHDHGPPSATTIPHTQSHVDLDVWDQEASLPPISSLAMDHLEDADLISATGVKIYGTCAECLELPEPPISFTCVESFRNLSVAARHDLLYAWMFTHYFRHLFGWDVLEFYQFSNLFTEDDSCSECEFSCPTYLTNLHVRLLDCVLHDASYSSDPVVVSKHAIFQFPHPRDVFFLHSWMELVFLVVDNVGLQEGTAAVIDNLRHSLRLGKRYSCLDSHAKLKILVILCNCCSKTTACRTSCEDICLPSSWINTC